MGALCPKKLGWGAGDATYVAHKAKFVHFRFLGPDFTSVDLFGPQKWGERGRFLLVARWQTPEETRCGVILMRS